jgi:hypothetical protein
MLEIFGKNCQHDLILLYVNLSQIIIYTEMAYCSKKLIHDKKHEISNVFRFCLELFCECL